MEVSVEHNDDKDRDVYKYKHCHKSKICPAESIRSIALSDLSANNLWLP